jgi:streptomycin 6-kinase
VPRRWVDQATILARELAATAVSSLVHADLHYGNILAGAREPWLAVDPHAVSGDPEQSVPELMWTRIDELDDSAVRALLDVIVDTGRLDADKAFAWTIVRAVDYWLWGLPIGLTIDPARCQRLLRIMMSA